MSYVTLKGCLSIKRSTAQKATRTNVPTFLYYVVIQTERNDYRDQSITLSIWIALVCGIGGYVERQNLSVLVNQLSKP